MQVWWASHERIQDLLVCRVSVWLSPKLRGQPKSFAAHIMHSYGSFVLLVRFVCSFMCTVVAWSCFTSGSCACFLGLFSSFVSWKNKYSFLKHSFTNLNSVHSFKIANSDAPHRGRASTPADACATKFRFVLFLRGFALSSDRWKLSNQYWSTVLEI